jgi:hypothetical protein
VGGVGFVRAAAVRDGGETMKLYQLSWFLGTWSYIIGGVFRRSGLPLGEMSIGIQGVATFLLMILPAGIGIVLGMMSLKRKEVKSWWAIGVIVLNIVMVLSGILLLSPD